MQSARPLITSKPEGLTYAPEAWFTAHGDETFALDWPLNEHSTVFEIGAYKGRWAAQMWDKYRCRIWAFEPQDWAFAELLQVAASREGIYPVNLALSDSYANVQMGEFGTDACSFLKRGERAQGTGRTVSMRGFMLKHEINFVDLAMINIEGFEYFLLDHMLMTGITDNIDRLCIQWHTFADPDGSRYASLERRLREHYRLMWSFFPTLQAWERK